MSQKKTHQEIFQEIMETKSYKNLSLYFSDDQWRQLPLVDQYSLADLLMLQGAEAIGIDEETVFKAFDMANHVRPNHPYSLYAQGVALASYRANSVYLSRGIATLKSAISLSPQYFDALYFLAKLKLHLSHVTDNERYVEKAQPYFLQASTCRPEIPEVEANFYWDWGLADSFLGKVHGEAIDYKKAVHKFSVAAGLGLNKAAFWEHYGHAVCELGKLMNSSQNFVEARKYFERSLLINPAYTKSKFKLALCCYKIYEILGNSEDYEQGSIAFQAAEEAYSQHAPFWFHWALLEFAAGRLNADATLVKSAFKKFEQAHQCDPDSPEILAKWAEAEMIFGVYNEKFDYLRMAESRIVKALRQKNDSAEMWCTYGSCLLEIGRYFSEDTYFYQAIEKFQFGLSLAPQDCLISQCISLAYFSLGEMTHDPAMIEQSIFYSQKAIDSAPVLTLQLYNDLAVAYMKLAEITAEKEYLEAAIEKFEFLLNHYNEESAENFDNEWIYNYGCALDFFGDFHDDATYYEKAIKLLTKFLKAEPSYFHAHYNLASAYSHLGELVGDVDCFHKAIEHYQIFLQEDQEDELAWNDYGLTLLNLADLLTDPSLPSLSQACLTQAEEKFLHAVSLGSKGAFYNLACLYSLTQHYEQALFFIEKAEQHQALPHLDDLMEDEWLENLHQTEAFRDFLTNLSLRKKDND